MTVCVPDVTVTPEGLLHRLRSVRGLSRDLAACLSDADATVQSMPDASPAKWHLAHTTWFFETFILRDHVPDYRLYDARWPFLFNSYYEAEGARHARPERGLLTRPSLTEVLAYREHVDTALADALPDLGGHVLGLVELGLHHEQQHQELLLTDLLHLFSRSPLGPAYAPADLVPGNTGLAPLRWLPGRSGLVEIGHAGKGFAFDNEGPVHQQFLVPHALANRPVLNAEWIEFIEDAGYASPRLWLSDGWAWVGENGINTPLYWRQTDQGWEQFTLAGWRSVDPAAPVAHVSFYEADAFATWAGARLPTEFEWEAFAASHDPEIGHQLDSASAVMPRAIEDNEASLGLFGHVWEWTGSAYRPHPGFRPAPGAVGEYNGKFMSGQFVLKGAGCATPRGHSRATYRNFFHPEKRWQFTGLRLAKDL